MNHLQAGRGVQQIRLPTLRWSVVCACESSTQEAETGGFQVGDQPGPNSPCFWVALAHPIWMILPNAHIT